MPLDQSAVRSITAVTVAGLSLFLTGCSVNRAADSGAVVETWSPSAAVFKVDGMACPNCAKEIEHELAEVPGVRKATIDFKSETARVSLDPAQPASMESMQAAIAKWRKEHFSVEEDPNCLDPERRKQLLGVQ